MFFVEFVAFVCEKRIMVFGSGNIVHNPGLYILSLQQKNEKVFFFNDKTILGAISMTSFEIK
jgi:aromatic ring-opening dioxygenase catalytic subunit (LigB family)